MQAVTLRFLADASAATAAGKVHGGAVMKWIDEAGYACASGWSRQECVTVFVGSIRFHRAVMAGALVEVEARLAYTGRTGMNIAVEVRAADLHAGGTMQRTTECLIVFVAVDEQGRPVPVRPWRPETPGDMALAERARAYLDTARRGTDPHGDDAGP